MESNFNSLSDAEIIQANLGNPDIMGVYKNAQGKWVLDRRLTFEAMERRGLSPRTADLNIIGADVIDVPESLIQPINIKEQ